MSTIPMLGFPHEMVDDGDYFCRPAAGVGAIIITRPEYLTVAVFECVDGDIIREFIRNQAYSLIADNWLHAAALIHHLTNEYKAGRLTNGGNNEENSTP